MYNGIINVYKEAGYTSHDRLTLLYHLSGHILCVGDHTEAEHCNILLVPVGQKIAQLCART